MKPSSSCLSDYEVWTTNPFESRVFQMVWITALRKPKGVFADTRTSPRERRLFLRQWRLRDIYVRSFLPYQH